MSMSAEQIEMVNAARRGDRSLLDRVELKAISLLTHPHHADGRFYVAGDDYQVLMPTEILRAWGPRGIAAIAWSLVTPCGKCWRRLSLKRCPKCYGDGHLTDIWDRDLITDMDGLVLEDGDGNRL